LKISIEILQENLEKKSKDYNYLLKEENEFLKECISKSKDEQKEMEKCFALS
jgi:hypothetical protein